MIKNVLSHIGGVGIYGVISICLFVLVFGGALIRTLFLKKSFLEKMSGLPLEEARTPADLGSRPSLPNGRIEA